MHAERVVELTFGSLSAGSGYLITPRHVLTARHVVKPLTEGTACTVQPLVPSESTGQRRPTQINGRVAWFANPKSRPDLDVAIVEVDPLAFVDLAPAPMAFGAVPVNDIAPRSFLCAGFPAAAGKGNKTVEGTLSYVPTLRRFDLSVLGALPRDWRQWAGLSGAVVFCGPCAVAVVHTVDANWDRTLTATPVQLMVEDESFQIYWSTQALPIPALQQVMRFEPTMLERISEHVYLIDRKHPVETIKRHLRGLPAQVPSQIVAIVGLEDDEHAHLIRQLSDDAQVQHLLGREAKSEDVIVPLPWPVELPQIDPNERFRILLERMCAAAGLVMPAVGQLPNPADLRTTFDQGATPRAFWTLVRRKIACGGHSHLLRRLLEFWESLGTGLPVFLFLGLAWDDPEPPSQHRLSFLLGKRPQPEIELEAELESAYERLKNRLVGVGPLTIIETDHIGAWIDDLRYRCRTLRPGQLEGLRLSLLNRIGQGKRARQVAADLGELLRNM